jgi:hypothetical protein
MPKKRSVTVKQMNDYAFSVVGYRCRTGVSAYEICARALRKAGFSQPQGMRDKPWVISMADVVKRGSRALRVKALEEKVAAPSQPCPNYPGDVNTPEFLGSFQWRALRLKVLQHYGRRCLCCGASPDNGKVMHVDHIKPRRLFPHLALDFDNLQVLCEDCNHGKGNHDHTDFRPAVGEFTEERISAMLRDIARGG